MGEIAWRLLVILLLCSLTGCRPIKKTRDAFGQTPYCYNASKTRLSEKIELRGWYGFMETSGNSSYEVNCVFFEDGMFIYHFNPEYVKESGDQTNGLYLRGTQWGKYVLDGDTIRAQFIEPPGGMAWSIGQIWFQIVDRKTLKWLAFKYGDPIDVAKIKQYQNRSVSTGLFHPALIMPDTNKAWIMSRSWFWCDIENFRLWKQKSRR